MIDQAPSSAASPEMLLALAAIVFLIGCAVLAFRPNWWRSALVVSAAGMALAVALIVGMRL